MDKYLVAAVGISDKDVTVLKSIMNLVASSRGVEWQMVDKPEDAHVAFLGHLEPQQVEALADEIGGKVMLVYCCSRDEAPPDRVRTLAHCPPRANELGEVFAEAVLLRGAAQQAAQQVSASAAAAASASVAASELFSPEKSLAGVIHAKLLRLLIDQPLSVSIPGAPCLLVDIHNGLRTVHADPAWFTSPDFLRSDPATCKMEVATDARLLSECRRQVTRPYQSLRWWGTLSASQGRPVADIARAKSVGLKKLPEFKVLTHRDWQLKLAEALVGKQLPPAQLAEMAGQPLADVIDFLNACSVLGLLKTA